jgi:hypothetical protein
LTWPPLQRLKRATMRRLADVVDGQLAAVPRGIMAAGNVMQGSRGGVDLPQSDINRVKSHLAKYYKKMGEEAPWQRD